MKIRILFESKDACKEEYEQGISSGKAYQEQQDTLTNWKKTHKMMRYVIFLLRVAVVVGLIWLFFFYDISREVHFYMNDADTMVRSIIMDISTFFVLLIYMGKLSGYLYKRAILNSEVLPEPWRSPEQRNRAHKYERYKIIESLLHKEENAQIAIDIALSSGFRIAMGQGMHTMCNCAILDFDREQTLFSG